MLNADISVRYARDLHRMIFASVISGDGRVVAGGLRAMPPSLPVDGRPRWTRVERDTGRGAVSERARVLARRLPDGRVLVFGRTSDDLVKLRTLVGRAISLGLAPGGLLAAALFIAARVGTTRRVQRMNATIARIMDGRLGERLEPGTSSGAFDQLARSVNRMLDEIERLVGEVRGVGDDIAHDLRTPLTRVRTQLEGARTRATTHEAALAAIDRAIAGLDQGLGVVTALLRIAEIDGGRRRGAFAAIDLAALVMEAGELYAPVAEERGIAVEIAAEIPAETIGDRDLLLEVIANLLDNAIKFTPAGGRVRVETRREGGLPAFAVRDSGQGIAGAERPAVLRRFYRSETSRRVEGSGLGLSIVAAILRLHGFSLRMEDRDGLFGMVVVCGEA